MTKYLVLQGNEFNKKLIKEFDIMDDASDYVVDLIYKNKYNGKFFMKSIKTSKGFKFNYGSIEDFYYIEVIDNG